MEFQIIKEKIMNLHRREKAKLVRLEAVQLLKPTQGTQCFIAESNGILIGIERCLNILEGTLQEELI